MTIEPTGVLFVTSLLTAAVGAGVATIAYRGYRRNDSAMMRFLAIGIAFLTVPPFLFIYGVAPAAGLEDAMTLLLVVLATIAGLLSILYSLEAT